MELLMSALGIAGLVVTAVLLGLLKDETSSWLPLLTQKIIDIAVLKMPKDKRGHYQEEWTAHVWEYPGKLSQVVQALLCLQASDRLAEKTRFDKMFRSALVSSVLVLCAQGVITYVMHARQVKAWESDTIAGLAIMTVLAIIPTVLVFRLWREGRKPQPKSPD